TTSGIDRAAPNHSRRVRSFSSVSSAAPVPAIGTSAMPHLGHEPGPTCKISGCIGQVYWAPLTGAGVVAVPDFARYFAGSALNVSRQCVLQKWYVVPRCSNDPAAD